MAFIVTYITLAISCNKRIVQKERSSYGKKDDNSNTLTDIDGNVYRTVTIGTQVWMAENLKTTKYNDGTSIPLVKDSIEWLKLVTPGYCWYKNNEASYKATYGALYNWFTVSTGKLCPIGWHVPIDKEWKTLTDYLGGVPIAGGKLKETGTVHWVSPNTGATNETGFTALPGGNRTRWDNNVTFGGNGFDGNWWTASEHDTTSAYNRAMEFQFNSDFEIIGYKMNGFSVRCVKDSI